MEVLTRVEPERIRALRERDEYFWLDLDAPAADAVRGAAELLGLHPLAVEDTIEFGQRPKVDSFEDHVLLVIYTARISDDGRATEPVEVHVYVHGGFILTVSRDAGGVVSALHDRLRACEPEVEEEIVHAVLDGLADAVRPVIEALDRRVDALEARVLTTPRDDQLPDLYRLKQEIGDLQRRVRAQREMFGAAIDAVMAVPGLTLASRPYLRDVADAVSETDSDLRRLAGDLSGLTDTFFNANAMRMSRQSSRLTVVATFFVVVTVVTGFFGQNFQYLTDKVASRADFLVFGLGGVLVPALVLAIFFYVKRDEWW